MELFGATLAADLFAGTFAPSILVESKKLFLLDFGLPSP
jgi:hypothetical protein